MTVMIADFNYILPLIIIIGVIASLVDKARKAADEAKRQQNRMPERRPRADLPEATRRQIYGTGEPTVRRARPLVVEVPQPPETEGRNDAGEGLNDEDWSVPPAQPRPAQPVYTAPATTPWGELRRQMEQKARDFEQEVRRQVAEANQQRTGQAPPRTEYERQEQLRRKQREAEQARLRQATPRRERSAEPPKPQPAPRPAPAPQRPPRPRRRGHPLFGNGQDIRRAIVLREVLGPPKSLE